MADSKEFPIGVFLTFTPKFNPLQKVRVWITRKVSKTGRITDCLGTFVFVTHPNGSLVETKKPDETNIQYGVTFDGNANNVEWFFEYELEDVGDGI